MVRKYETKSLVEQMAKTGAEETNNKLINESRRRTELKAKLVTMSDHERWIQQRYQMIASNANLKQPRQRQSLEDHANRIGISKMHSSEKIMDFPENSYKLQEHPGSYTR